GVGERGAVVAGEEGFVDRNEGGGLAGGVGGLEDEVVVVELERAGVNGGGTAAGVGDRKRIHLAVGAARAKGVRAGGADDERARANGVGRERARRLGLHG